MSKNGIGLSILVIEALLTSLGVEFEPGTVAKATEGIVVFIGLALAIWNQIARTDVRKFIFKG